MPPTAAGMRRAAGAGRRPRPTSGATTKSCMSFGDRRYRVRGLAKNLGLRSAQGQRAGRAQRRARFYVDTFDLYAARARAHFIAQAAKELAVART